MSSSSAFAVRLEPRRAAWARWLGAALAGLLLLAAWSCSELDAGWLLSLPAIVAWLGRPSAQPPSWLLVGRRVERPDQPAGAELRHFAVLGPLLSLQLVQDTGRRQSLLFGPWNLSQEQRRQLRLHLRRLEATG